MLYLLQTFWLWLALASLLGFIMSWLSHRAETPGTGWTGLIPWALALGSGAMIAWLQVLPNRAGYWFDLAVLMLAAYLAGCVLAGFLRAAGRAGAQDPAVATPRVSPVIDAPPAKPEPSSPIMVDMPYTTPSGEVPVEPMKPQPKAVPSPEPVEQVVTGLSAPRHGKPDDLTQIYGVDADVQRKLNDLGLYHFDQIAALQPGQRRWLFRQLGHSGRFPSWWWRWRYDAEQIVAGKTPETRATQPVALAPTLPAVEEKPAEGSQPVGLAAPKGGKADDLKRIKGIGKQNEGRLHGLGIWHFDQIARWTADEVTWVGSYLAFPGRIEREDWVGQARILAEGGVTDFARRADAGEVATSRDETNDDGQGNVTRLLPDGRKPRNRPGKT